MDHNIKLSIVVLEVLGAIVLLLLNLYFFPEKKAESLQAMASPTSSPIAIAMTPEPEVLPAVTQQIQQIDEQVETPPVVLPKESYTIAFYGDSMIETMGTGLPYVHRLLTEKYPENDFVLYNYGIGAENMVEGMSRFSIPHSYKDREYEPITKLKADVIVLGSYSYNPLTPFDKNESWMLLAEFINKAKSTGAKVYLLAEQAPKKEGFATGVGGVNWPPEISDPHVEKIIQGLKNAVGLAEATEVSLINVYEESKISGSEYGNPEYVAAHDGIHYSEEGQEFTAQEIVESLVFE